MTESRSSADVAVAYIEAWARGDKDSVAALIAQDVTFESPTERVSGAKDVLDVIMPFAELVTGVQIRSVLGDDTQALIMYEMTTAPFGTLRGADHLEIRAGKIQTDTLVFDTYEVRMAQAAESRSG